MRVLRVDEWLGRLNYPALRTIDAPEVGPGDLLVLCAGFEDRATEMLRRAVARGSRGFEVICIDYLPAVSENKTSEISDLCKAAGAALDFVTFDREQPSGAAGEILDAIPRTSRIFVDLSGMSRLLIVQLVAAIVRDGRSESSQILYCSAKEYPPTQAEVDKKLADAADLVEGTMFVSAGIFGLTIVPELSTVAMQGQPIRLIAFPSWNTTQFVAVCAEMQASYFTVVHGIPPDPQNRWRRDAIRAINRVDSLPPRDEFDVSTLNYAETIRLLLDVYVRYGQREKLVISPTGSKMQSLAVGLMCGFLSDLQIVYPTPRKFAAPVDYTRGVGELYRVPLKDFVWSQFSNLGDLRATA